MRTGTPAPAKQVVPAHEIALKHAETNPYLRDASVQAASAVGKDQSALVGERPPATEEEKREARRRRKEARQPRENTAAATGGQPGGKAELDRKKETEQSQTVSEIRQNRATKERRRQTFI